MNDFMDTQEFSSVNQYQVGETFEAVTMDHGVSSSSSLSKSTAGESQKLQQKFKSRHFPEPFWGYDD
ncbi:MAG TPA: hypothetical protein VGE40_09780 [Bacilli bacterium]